MAEDVIDVFADNGFFGWGGYWDTPIDYQHFQVNRKLAERLAGSTPLAAKTAFDRVVANYRECRQAGRNRSGCIEAVERIDNPVELSRARPAQIPASVALTR